MSSEQMSNSLRQENNVDRRESAKKMFPGEEKGEGCKHLQQQSDKEKVPP